MEDIYIASMRNLFAYYKGLGKRAMEQIPEGKIDRNQKDKSNNLPVIVKHLVANMLPWWTGFLARGGDTNWSKEQIDEIYNIDNEAEMNEYWEKAWASLVASMEDLKPEDLEKEIYIGKESFTVLEAINRQLGHYAYHVGQIVMVAKEIMGDGWKSVASSKDKKAQQSQA
jgi:hypothetical protein